MSKMKLLFEVVSELRSLADSLEAVAKAIEQPQTAADETEKFTETKKENSEPQITLEQVRAALAEKSNEGYTAQVRELLKKYGADRLSAIDPSEYASLLADAEVLGNG